MNIIFDNKIYINVDMIEAKDLQNKRNLVEEINNATIRESDITIEKIQSVINKISLGEKDICNNKQLIINVNNVQLWHKSTGKRSRETDTCSIFFYEGATNAPTTYVIVAVGKHIDDRSYNIVYKSNLWRDEWTNPFCL